MSNYDKTKFKFYNNLISEYLKIGEIKKLREINLEKTDQYVLIMLFSEYVKRSSSKTYINYVNDQIKKLKQLGFRPFIYNYVSVYVATLNEEISHVDRKQHNILLPHDSKGEFHALWMAFFAYSASWSSDFGLNKSKNSILYRCYKDSQIFWKRLLAFIWVVGSFF